MVERDKASRAAALESIISDPSGLEKVDTDKLQALTDELRRKTAELRGEAPDAGEST